MPDGYTVTYDGTADTTVISNRYVEPIDDKPTEEPGDDVDPIGGGTDEVPKGEDGELPQTGHDRRGLKINAAFAAALLAVAAGLRHTRWKRCAALLLTAGLAVLSFGVDTSWQFSMDEVK